MNVSTLSPNQLRTAADLQEKIQALQAELTQMLGCEISAPAPVTIPAPGSSARPADGRKPRRKLRPQAIANIRAGVAKRVAKRGGKKPATLTIPPEVKPIRKMSPAGRRALSLSAKARWAKAKAQGKATL